MSGCIERGFTLHELLGESCALVTDVSSAYVDYLLLDRPIVHHFPDIEAYGHSRGYSFEPIQDYLAGPVVDDPAGSDQSPLGRSCRARILTPSSAATCASCFTSPWAGRRPSAWCATWG